MVRISANTLTGNGEKLIDSLVDSCRKASDFTLNTETALTFEGKEIKQ
jgi:hypothetical protein